VRGDFTYSFLETGVRRPEIVPLSMDESASYEADGGRMDALIYTHYSIDTPPVYTSPRPDRPATHGRMK
jgi:hypothetical protein